MKKLKKDIFNVKGIVLDNEQLANYMEKLAINYSIQTESNIDTYPIPRVKDNFLFIEKTYNLLTDHLKEGIDIYPAGEWLLDNFYVIEESVKRVAKDLTLKSYKNLPGLAEGSHKGLARIYLIAEEIVSYRDCKIDDETLGLAINAYQRRKCLSMEEIWNLNVFLQIALIQSIRNICEKIFSAEQQKYKVENIVERLVEKKEIQDQKFKINNVNMKNEMTYSELKFPFIEYMSFKLKKYGKQGIQYLNILEEQVNKMGFTVSDVIKKEHYDIAIKKVLIGNAITSIREISRINFSQLFEEINGVEEFLKKDPANIYLKMDYKTKEHYRNKIKELAKKTKISENYIAKEVLNLAKNKEGKKAHIGYYLIDNGFNELANKLNIKPKQKNVNNKVNIYISLIYVTTLICSFLIGGYLYFNIRNILYSIILAIFAFIPISEITVQIINYILVKSIKPTLIPKLDFETGIPKDLTTMVIIPTIINSGEKVREIVRKMEVYYLANKSDNLYFTLLGDCTSSKNKNEEFDIKIIDTGKQEIEKLNKKYGKNIFNFIYRNRTWNSSEKCYLGWERKRGLITEFNEFLINGTNNFRVNTIESQLNIKYIITLDSDTNLVLNSAFELIGAMAHILNIPVINERRNIVIDGHAIIQPRVGINLDASRKSLFTKIYAGVGGTDSYAKAISDIYQDNFNEGIFTGKGIYDLKVFHKVLKDEIPENTVLSHDLLEGSYLRCGLATDIILMDGYPEKYNSYIMRLHRWVRGDWQLVGWLKNKTTIKNGVKKTNPLNNLSKYKILDNLRRSLVPVVAFLLFIISIIFKLLGYNTENLIIIALVSILMPTILDLINLIVFRKNLDSNTISAHKNMVKVINPIKASLFRSIIEISLWPYKAFKLSDAIIRTIYRLKVSRQNLLEWMTSDEAEKQSKVDIKSYYKEMWINPLIAILVMFCGIVLNNLIIISISILFIVGPYLGYYISKEKQEKKPIDEINDSDKQYVLEIGKRTWQFFKDNINSKNNFLPPDNFQEDRKEKVATRTSPTNIGLGMLAVISAYDLKYIDLNSALDKIEKMLNTVSSLQKWNGHLYNWYNTITLEPLYPKYISTVDSGNFIGYLYTLKSFLETNTERQDLIEIIENIIKNTNFKVLYDYKKRLFSIGFNIEENRQTDSYYDLLASEARQASLIAIAKKDVPVKHWNSLSRTLTTLNKYKGLISWSGTAFEYLMPNVNIKRYKGSLLDESCRFMIMSQKEYAKKLGIPWGISEAAFNLRDLNNNYQYKAFGIPWLGLKRGLEEDMVVSPYSVFLSMQYEPKEAIENLKVLEKQDMYNQYGFFEAIDYTTDRLNINKTYEPVKTYMAHHQGLILLSINNLINNDILVKRFSANPEIEAINILLQERMPDKAIITKEKKEKVERIKIKDYESNYKQVFTKYDTRINPSNIISNGKYTVCNFINGESISKYGNIAINRYKETDDLKQGIFFYIKNLNQNTIWNTYPSNNEKSKVIFESSKTEYIKTNGNIEAKENITVAPDEAMEIRRLTLKNIGNNFESLEITSAFEPVISRLQQDYAHMAFNNLFLNFERLESGSILIKRKKRGEAQKEYFLGVSLYTEAETIGDLEYEIDKEKFVGKGINIIPEMIKYSKPYSKSTGLGTDPILAMKRTVKIPPGETFIIDLIITIDEQKEKVIENLNKFENTNIITRTFELSKAKIEAENIYLGVKGKNIEIYQKMLRLLLFQNPTKAEKMKNLPKRIYSQSELWKYGISGDLPILLTKINDVNDVYIIYELLKAYEFFRAKNIRIDLVFLNEEINSYDNYIRFEIENAIQNKQLGYLKNKSGGIFIIDKKDLSNEDVELIEFRANLSLDSRLGNIKTLLNDLEEEYLSKVKEINEEKKALLLQEEKLQENIDDLKYYNEFGGFQGNGLEYKIITNRQNVLPTVWSNILANNNFGTLITQNLGGFTWASNSRLNRLSSWQNNPIQDFPSEIICFKDIKTGAEWSLSKNILDNNQDYSLTYGFGYATIKTVKNGIMHDVQIFVPKENNIKISIINLKNTTAENKKIKLLYYIKPVLGEDEIWTNSYIDVIRDGNIVIAKNLYKNEFKDNIMYVSSNLDISSYTGKKRLVMKNGNIMFNNMDNKSGLGENTCMAIELELELRTFESKEIILMLGAENSILDIKNTVYKFSKSTNCKEELKKEKDFWYQLLTKIQVKTPLESMNIMLNGWAVYQTIVSRLWSRTGYYQSGGAIGFRDQLQDTLGIKYIDSNLMKNQILKHASHQFIEGDVEHWWHEETNKGIRTRFSDDLLWLCYVVYEYIDFTGDYEILDEEVSYLQGDILEEGVDERYDEYLESNISEPLYNHCIRAIEKSLDFGENGLPKIGSGDWNDGLNTVGNKKRGESVWLRFFPI